MEFSEFIKSGKVKIVQNDIQKSKSLMQMSKNTLNVFGSLIIDKNSASVLLSNHYEALREIVEAIALKNGYKIYSHEAYTAYLKNLGELGISESFDRLRKLRNGINYYGRAVSVNTSLDAKKQVKLIVKKLKQKYLFDL